MKVKELIKKLQELDQDEEIVMGYIDSEWGNIMADIEEITFSTYSNFDNKQGYILCESEDKEFFIND